MRPQGGGGEGWGVGHPFRDSVAGVRIRTATASMAPLGRHHTRTWHSGHETGLNLGLQWHQIVMMRGEGGVFPGETGPDRSDPALS